MFTKKVWRFDVKLDYLKNIYYYFLELPFKVNIY